MDVEDKIYQARIAGSQGDFASARALLKEVLDEDARNVEAWLLLTDVVDRPEFSLKCLQRVLKLDPENEIAAAKLAEWQAVQDVALEGEHWVTPEPKPAAASVHEFDSEISAPSQPAATRPSARKRWTYVVIGMLTICAVVLIGVLVLMPGVAQPQKTANAAAGPSVEEVTAVIFENIRASNLEDMEAYMATIHPESPGYQQTQEMLAPTFEAYDLAYEINDLSITSQGEDEAVVTFVMTTHKINGPEFRDNQVSGEMILRIDAGSWKIYSQAVNKVEYLE
ncbi:MAG: tetratricopeptide repeat protein [Anaerolineales bacterium]|jgi:hypothetical protein